MYPSATPFFIGDLLEHLLDDRRSYRVDDRMALFVCMLLVVVADRRDAGAQPHLASRPQPALHVHTPIVVFELRLAPQYHEQEFFVRVVAKALTECAYLLESARIHEVDNLAEVARIAADAVRCPRQDAVVLSCTQFLDYLVEDRPLAGFFCRVRFALHFDHLQSFPVGELEHFLDL